MVVSCCNRDLGFSRVVLVLIFPLAVDDCVFVCPPSTGGWFGEWRGCRGAVEGVFLVLVSVFGFCDWLLGMKKGRSYLGVRGGVVGVSDFGVVGRWEGR